MTKKKETSPPEVSYLYSGDVEITFYPGRHYYKARVQRKDREGKPSMGLWSRQVYVPSVTTITGMVDKSGPLMGWAVKMAVEYVRERIEPNTRYDHDYLAGVLDNAKRAHRKEKEKAGDIGKAVHDWIHKHVQHKMDQEGPLQGVIEPALPKPGDPAMFGIAAFLAWESEHDIEYLESEKVLYSVQHNYVGTTDLIASVDGVLTLIDMKTSKRVYDEFAMQLTAYAEAYNEERLLPVKARLILHLPKTTGEFRAFDLEREAITDKGHSWDEEFAAFLGARALARRFKGA